MGKGKEKVSGNEKAKGSRKMKVVGQLIYSQRSTTATSDNTVHKLPVSSFHFYLLQNHIHYLYIFLLIAILSQIKRKGHELFMRFRVLFDMPSNFVIFGPNVSFYKIIIPLQDS